MYALLHNAAFFKTALAKGKFPRLKKLDTFIGERVAPWFYFSAPLIMFILNINKKNSEEQEKKLVNLKANSSGYGGRGGSSSGGRGGASDGASDSQIKNELPFPTKVLLQVDYIFENYAFYILGITVFLFIIFAYFYKKNLLCESLIFL